MKEESLGRPRPTGEQALRWCIAVSLALLACFGYLMTSSQTEAQMTIAAAADRNALSTGNNVAVTLPSRIASSAISEWRRTSDTFSTQSVNGQPSSSIQWSGEIYSSDLIELISAPNGGTVDVTVNGKRTHLDLYDPFGKTFYIKLVSLAPAKSIITPPKVALALSIFALTLAISLIGLTLLLPPLAAPGSAHGPLLNTAYLQRLDHLRFGAAAIVLLYHFFHDYVSAGYRSHFPIAAIIADGHTGVALFMVLSGFIFAHIGLGKEINYKNFFLSRVVRIYPLYVFALVVAFSTKRWDFKPMDMALFAFPMVNFYSVLTVPYFGQLWTIGVEFQFYAIFPFLNKFTNTRGPRYLVGLLGLFVLLKGFYFNLYGDARDFGYWTILGRMDQFIIGMLAAVLYKRRPRYLSNHFLFPCAVVLALATLTVFNLHFGGYPGTGGSALWIVWPAIEAAVWAALALSYLCWPVTLPRGLDNLLANFGALSFSTYVMQYVAIPQLQRYIGIVPFFYDWNLNVFLAGLFFAVPAALLLSGITYSVIERPFFAFKFRYTSPCIVQDASGMRPKSDMERDENKTLASS